MAAGASAGIVFTPVDPLTGTLENAGDIVPIDFDGDGNREVEIQYTEPVTNNLNIKIEAFPDTGTPNVTDEILADPSQVAGNVSNPLALAFGEDIGPDETATRAWQFIGRTNAGSGTSPSGISGSNGGGNFRFGDPEQFIGVRTIINGQTHYGWVGILITDELDGPTPDQDRLSGLVTGYAFESQPNVAITAGAIPAPGAAALLALGGLGLGTRGRRACS